MKNNNVLKACRLHNHGIGDFCVYIHHFWSYKTVVERHPAPVVRCLLLKENYSLDFCSNCKLRHSSLSNIDDSSFQLSLVL